MSDKSDILERINQIEKSVLGSLKSIVIDGLKDGVMPDIMDMRNTLDNIKTLITGQLTEKIFDVQTAVGFIQNGLNLINKTVETLKTKEDTVAPIDFGPILEQLNDIKANVDITAVFASLDEIKGIVNAIQTKEIPEPDLSSVNDSLDSLKSQLTEIANKPEPEPINIAVMEDKIAAIKTDTEAILNKPEPKATEAPDVDLSSVLDSISKVQDTINTIANKPEKEIPAVDLTPVLNAVSELKTIINSLPKEFPASQPIDFSPVTDKITEVQDTVNKFSEDTKPQESKELDITPILSALDELKTSIDEVKAKEYPITDLGPIEEKISMVKVDTESILAKPEIKLPEPPVTDFTPILDVIKEVQSKIDNLPKSETQASTIDFTPILDKMNELQSIVTEINNKEIPKPTDTSEIQNKLVEIDTNITNQNALDEAHKEAVNNKLDVIQGVVNMIENETDTTKQTTQLIKDTIDTLSQQEIDVPLFSAGDY